MLIFPDFDDEQDRYDHALDYQIVLEVEDNELLGLDQSIDVEYQEASRNLKRKGFRGLSAEVL